MQPGIKGNVDLFSAVRGHPAWAVGPRSSAWPEVVAFCGWLKLQAAVTRQAIGDVPDADTVDLLD